MPSTAPNVPTCPRCCSTAIQPIYHKLLGVVAENVCVNCGETYFPRNPMNAKIARVKYGNATPEEEAEVSAFKRKRGDLLVCS